MSTCGPTELDEGLEINGSGGRPARGWLTGRGSLFAAKYHPSPSNSGRYLGVTRLGHTTGSWIPDDEPTAGRPFGLGPPGGARHYKTRLRSSPSAQTNQGSSYTGGDDVLIPTRPVSRGWHRQLLLSASCWEGGPDTARRGSQGSAY